MIKFYNELLKMIKFFIQSIINIHFDLSELLIDINLKVFRIKLFNLLINSRY